jgi:AraC family transcriptional regulator
MEQPTITKEEIILKVIYLSYRGSYIGFRRNAMRMYKTLIAFAEANHLIITGISKIMTIYHDNPYISKADDLRTSLAMSVPLSAQFETTGDIGTLVIEGKFAVLHFMINRKEYDQAWHYAYHEWLFKSNEQPRDSFPFEMYITEPPKNAHESSQTDIYLPIE